jgi:hypothetical protein
MRAQPIRSRNQVSLDQLGVRQMAKLAGSTTDGLIELDLPESRHGGHVEQLADERVPAGEELLNAVALALLEQPIERAGTPPLRPRPLHKQIEVATEQVALLLVTVLAVPPDQELQQAVVALSAGDIEGVEDAEQKLRACSRIPLSAVPGLAEVDGQQCRDEELGLGNDGVRCA